MYPPFLTSSKRIKKEVDMAIIPVIGKKLGRCPNCLGQLIVEIDQEGRAWAKCTDCKIRISLE